MFVCNFVNRISASHQEEEPPQSYGGIAADPMGLGKTLTMIALAASDLESSLDTAKGSTEREVEDKPCIAATLVVIPPPRKPQVCKSATRYLLIDTSPRYLGRTVV